MNRAAGEAKDVVAFRNEQMLQEIGIKIVGANPVHKILASRHRSPHDSQPTLFGRGKLWSLAITAPMSY